jgi:hypothetical protein
MPDNLISFPAPDPEITTIDSRLINSLADALCAKLRIRSDDRGLTFVIGTGSEHSNREAVRVWLENQCRQGLSQQEQLQLMEKRLERQLASFCS